MITNLDYGLFQGESEELNYIIDFNPLYIDYILLTHSHTDHYGLLPLLDKKVFSRNIYFSKLIKIVLHDCAKICANDTNQINK